MSTSDSDENGATEDLLASFDCLEDVFDHLLGDAMSTILIRGNTSDPSGRYAVSAEEAAEWLNAADADVQASFWVWSSVYARQFRTPFATQANAMAAELGPNRGAVEAMLATLLTAVQRAKEIA